jgi:hypothetical protein
MRTAGLSRSSLLAGLPFGAREDATRDRTIGSGSSVVTKPYADIPARAQLGRAWPRQRSTNHPIRAGTAAHEVVFDRRRSEIVDGERLKQ